MGGECGGTAKHVNLKGDTHEEEVLEGVRKGRLGEVRLDHSVGGVGTRQYGE